MRKVIRLYLLIAFCGIFYSFGMATYENLKVDSEIKKFIEKAQFVRVDELNRITYYEIKNDNSNFEYRAFYDDQQSILGQPGDILMSTGSNAPQSMIINTFVHYYFGKHAALVLNDGYIAEAIAAVDSAIDVLDNALWPRNKENISGTGIGISSNDWLNSNYFSSSSTEYKYYHGFASDEYFGIRVKGINDEDRRNIISITESIYEDDHMYNYLFFINNKNGYYCTSFIKEIYNRLGKMNDVNYNLDYDGFTVSVNDIVLGRDTYMFSYFKVDDNGMGHLYYLEGKKIWTL